MGQGLHHHLQPLHCLLVTIHSHHSSQHRGFQCCTNQTQITAFHTPTDVHVTQCRTLGFICTLAGWKLSHSIEFYVGFALLPKAQSCLSYKSEELLLQHYVFALSQLRDKVSPLVLTFVFQTWGLSHALLI